MVSVPYQMRGIRKSPHGATYRVTGKVSVPYQMRGIRKFDAGMKIVREAIIHVSVPYQMRGIRKNSIEKDNTCSNLKRFPSPTK